MYKHYFKRIIDILLSFTILLLLSWLIIFAFIFASIETRKNGFFTQIRVGKDGTLFRLFKIRTMYDNSEIKSTVTQKSDPRVTTSGSFFRKTKIDELPQLFNVLNGSMSLVGPRPTVCEDFKKMNTQQRNRYQVRPVLLVWLRLMVILL